jgi:hypothetical protein
VREIAVVRVQLLNVFDNVRNASISVSATGIDSIEISIPDGFYTVQTLSSTLDGLISVWQNQGLSNYVTADGGTLRWTLSSSGVNVNGQASSLVLGLPKKLDMRGEFVSVPLLGNPQSVAFCIPQLDFVKTVFSGKNSEKCRPTIIVPLSQGYGMAEVYEPANPFRIRCSLSELHNLTVEVRDTFDGSVLNCNGWSMELLVTTQS